MKNNQELQTDVQNAIRWEPLLNAAEITKNKLQKMPNTPGIWSVKNELTVDYECAFS